MKTSFALSLLFASLASSSPLQKRESNLTDIQILQYALTLENLEFTLYTAAVRQYGVGDFVAAGYPEWTHGRFQQIAEHEGTHVSFLTLALGDQAPKACNYSFPYTDPASFLALAQLIEGVGTSAYLGAAPLLQNKTILGAAGSILTTEARHAAWIASAINKVNAWSGAFDTALTPNQVYTLAGSFIDSCPDTNPTLPITPFPALTISSAQPGDNATITFNDTTNASGPFYMIVYAGQRIHHANITTATDPSTNTTSNIARIPPGLMGTSYAIITTDRDSPSDDNTVAGPAILTYPFDSTVRNLA